MQPLDPDTVSVVREWIEKADADLHVAEQMAAEAAVNLTGSGDRRISLSAGR